MSLNRMFSTSSPVLVVPGGGWSLPSQFVGIEVEVEGLDRTPYRGIRHWALKNDGSLRDGGCEFVLASPLCGVTLSEAISELFAVPCNPPWQENFRTSTHIHIDFSQPSDSVELLKALTGLVYAIEPIFFEIGSLERKHSNYCCPLDSLSVDSIAALYAFTSGRIGEDSFITSVADSDRYRGYNLQSIAKYGTVEFRYFPAPVSGPEGEKQLRSWVNFCIDVKKAAVDYLNDTNNPDLHRYIGDSPENAEAFLSRYLPGWRELIEQYLSPADISFKAAELDAFNSDADSTEGVPDRDNKFVLRFYQKNSLYSHYFYVGGVAPPDLATDSLLTPAQIEALAALEAMRVGTPVEPGVLASAVQEFSAPQLRRPFLAGWADDPFRLAENLRTISDE